MMKYKSILSLNRILLYVFFLGAMANGHAQQEFSSKTKWFQQRKAGEALR
jgi:hypothetical protein